MSMEYDNYLTSHISNVKKAFDWLDENLPEVINLTTNAKHNIEFAHDRSKLEKDEYEAYDKYFYGGNRSHEVVSNFNKAWLLHIHRNPHHWQHWVLINDDPKNGSVAIDMPYDYIVEMICDWWSFGFVKGELTELFTWYDNRKDYIIMSDKTRFTVEDILKKIKEKL